MLLKKYLLIIIYVGLCKTKSHDTHIVINSLDVHVNPKYGKFEVTLGKRTTAGYLNVTTELFKDWPGRPFEILVRVYKWADNHYKPTAIVIKRNACDVIDKDLKVLFPFDPPFFKNYLSCPLKKGVYIVKNFPVRLLDFPGLPFWKVKIVPTVTCKNEFVMNFTALVDIEENLN